MDVREELREVIAEGIREPLAVAAAGDVDADDARLARERAREMVEVAGVTAVSVAADDGPPRVAPAPFEVVQVVEPRDAQPAEPAVPGLGGALRRALRVRAAGGGRRPALRFESISGDGPLEERVGLDGAPVAFGGEPLVGGGDEALDALAHGRDEAAQERGDGDRAFYARLADVLFDSGEIRILVLEVHDACLLVEATLNRVTPKI
jgi:hypothetical protein